MLHMLLYDPKREGVAGGFAKAVSVASVKDKSGNVHVNWYAAEVQ